MADAACSNDMKAKAREVVESLGGEADGQHFLMTCLFVRGAFRHRADVAYARLMLECGEGVDEIEAYLHKTYRDDIHHRCDPVYPS